MIDTHAHLVFPEFDKDREDIIAEARKKMTAIIASSARYDESLKVMELCRKHRGFIFASLGYHPVEGTELEKTIQLIRDSKENIVAVGEVGLDFHWVKDKEKQELQRNVFERFINLAKEIKKPLVIHSWDAERDCYDMVQESGVECIFHCYSGKKDLAEEIIKSGFFISISTNVMFSKSLRKVARDLPLDRILLETDAPFLDPDRDRKRNVPWNIELSARKIAEIRKISKDIVIKATTENAIKLFGLRLQK